MVAQTGVNLFRYGSRLSLWGLPPGLNIPGIGPAHGVGASEIPRDNRFCARVPQEYRDYLAAMNIGALGFL